jgi:cysteine-rich repeat protein
LNTIFNSAINGCACPTGFYMDNYGICQKLVLKQVNCPDGQYFDTTNGCTPCSSSCKTCKSATQCITCATAGFSANPQGICAPVCGDGIIAGTESCDTGSLSSPGCVSCRIQPGYNCAGQPSVCRSTAPVTPVVPPATNTPSPSNNANVAPAGDPALSQVGSTNINSNNVFITLRTRETYTFPNPTEMQAFIKSSFPSGTKPTVYCAQRNSPNLNIFDCLLIYPSGVPNSQFQVDFSFNYQGKSGQATVRVNPLAAARATNRNA